MQNGFHRSWQNKFTGKLNYGFNIQFEDGTTGTCASENMIYPLAIGTQVSYEVTTQGNAPSHITKIKKLEPNASSNGRSYNDPVVVKRVAFSMCQTIARLHFANAGIPPRSPEEVNKLASIYNDWVLNGVPETDPHVRDLISRKYYALQLAVECIPFSGMGIRKKEQVIEAAETFLKPVNMIGHATPF